MRDSLFSFDRHQGAQHVRADEAGRAWMAGPLMPAALRFDCTVGCGRDRAAGGSE